MLHNNFDKMKNWPLVEKIKYTRKIIKKAYKQFGDTLSISCSFGKDSVLALFFARQIYPRIPVLFANTGVEYPETVKFARELAEKWDLNYYEIRPEKTFWQIVEKSGFPWPRSYKGKGTPRCCFWLKEKPLMDKIHELGIKATLTGITFSESYTRRMLILKHGDYYYVHKVGYWKIHPLAFWRENEVWKYIRANKIPINPAYHKYKILRVGCITCTGHIGWEKEIAHVNPRLYKFIMKKMREQKDPRARFLISDYF